MILRTLICNLWSLRLTALHIHETWTAVSDFPGFIQYPKKVTRPKKKN